MSRSDPSSTPRKFWVRRGGRTSGPFSAERVCSLAASGKLRPHDLIGGGETWRPASEYFSFNAPTETPSSPTTQAQDTEPQASQAQATQAHSTQTPSGPGGRWNFRVSISWLFLGTSLAFASPWFVFWPRPAEWLINLVPLAVTFGLVLWNLGASIRMMGRSGSAVAALPLTALQIPLFVLLFFQIAAHRGADHYTWDAAPGIVDWTGFGLLHAVRAAEMSDILEEHFLWNLQTIHGRSRLVRVTLIFYHVVIDLFVLSLLVGLVQRVKGKFDAQTAGRRHLLKFVGLLFLAGCVVGYLAVAVMRPWHWSDRIFWPIDNILHVADFMDVMTIYHLRLHSVPAFAAETTLTIIWRLGLWALLAGVVARHLRPAVGALARRVGALFSPQRRFAARFLPIRVPAEVAGGPVASEGAGWRSVVYQTLPSFHETLLTVGVWFVVLMLSLMLFPDPTARLLGAATGPDELEAQRALGALQRAGSHAESAVGPLAEARPALRGERQQLVIETLGSLGPAAIEPLAQLIQEDHPGTALAATEAVARIHPPAISPLIAALASSQAPVRRTARDALIAARPTVAQLAESLTPENAPALVRTLERVDRYWHLHRVENALFRKFASLRGQLLVLENKHASAEQVEAAIGQLNGIPELFPILRHFLAHDDAAIRQSVAGALVGRGAESTPFLAGSLSTSDAAVREAAIEALIRIGPEAVSELTSSLSNLGSAARKAAIEVLSGIGRAGVPAIAQLLSDADSAVRQSAAEALVKVGRDAVPDLVKALSDPYFTVRSSAAEALVKIGPDAVPELRNALSDSDATVGDHAAESLDKIGPDAVPELVKALSDSDSIVRSSAAEALGRIGPDAVPELVKALSDSDSTVRSSAAEALGRIGPDAKAAVPELVKALSDSDWRVRYSAAEALGKIGPDTKAAVPELAKVLSGSDYSVPGSAAEALGKIGPDAKAAVPELRKALSDWDNDVRRAANAAIRRIQAAPRQ